MVEGRSLVEQALAAGWQVEAQFVDGDTEGVACPAPVHRLAPGVLERVASTESPQPLIAVVLMRPVRLPERVTFLLVGDRLADPGNVGTIIRSAEAAGADGVVLTPGSVDPYNPKVVRSTAGSLFRVPVTVLGLGDLGALGVRCLAASSHRGAAYTDTDLTGPVALVVGNEAHGVDDGAPVDGWVTIPHHGSAESLNVAMAATVLAFEVARQRRRAHS